MVRFKNRYLLMEVLWKDGKTDNSMDDQQMLKILREGLESNFGYHALGLALASLQVKYFNPVTNLLILRCSRDQLSQVWCSASLISQIRYRTAMIRVVHHSGKLLCVQKAAVQYSADILAALPPSAKVQAGRVDHEVMAVEM